MIKKLAKISTAEFGRINDLPFLFGLQLAFKGDGWGIGTEVGRYTVNLNKECKWGTREERSKEIERIIDFTNDLLKSAKVNNVSELKGLPVEVKIDDNNTFEDFRILTEVL